MGENYEVEMSNNGVAEKRVASLSLLVVVAMTAAVGCSGGSGGGSGGEQKVMTFVAARAPDEPIGLLDRLGGSKAYTDLAGDVLMTLDPKNGELQPQLATKWEQTSPSDWTFTLREGVKFHNGEDFNAEAAAWNIQKQTEPDSPARVVRYAQGLTASSDGPTTLKVHCPSACPILDLIAPQFQFEAPKWAQENPEEAKDTPMGTGPFYLADRVDGQYLLYKKFDQYWGKTGYFDEVKIVWREEPSVRASMVSTGEAQLTEDLDPALISKVPKVFTPTPVDYAWIRLRDRDAEGNLDPIWGDKRFRQALAYAIDCTEMVRVLLNDASQCSAFPFNPATVGAIDGVGPRQYDPKKARELLDQVLGPGKQLDNVQIYSEAGDVPKLWAETIMTYWNDVGVHATFQYVDGDRREQLHSPGVDGTPPDAYIQRSHTNDLYDASITLAYTDGCNEPRSYSVCDQALTDRMLAAGTLPGEERRVAMETLINDVIIDGAHQIPLWDSPAIFGAAENLEWVNPQVGWLRPDLMSLSS